MTWAAKAPAPDAAAHKIAASHAAGRQHGNVLGISIYSSTKPNVGL
jgi:hypothetical protein